MAGSMLGLVALWIVATIRLTGRFGYSVDDAWIHLTIVRNLRDHGTFGMVPGVYESASSSPLWDLALTPLTFLPIPALWLPLILNVAAALWILWRFAGLDVVGRMLDSMLGKAALLLLPVALGLAATATTGMEHLAQAALALEILRRVTVLLDGDTGSPAALAALAACATLLRFETLFLVAASVCALLLVASTAPTFLGRVRRAAPLAVGAGAALVGFAMVNMAFGQSYLPNSVLAKTPAGSPIQADRVSAHLAKDPALVLLVLVTALVGFGAYRSGRRAVASTAFIAVATAVLHICLADVGTFDRYQEWLIVLLGWSALGAAPLASDASDAPVSSARTTVTAAAAAVLLLTTPRLGVLLLAPAAAEDISLVQQPTAEFFDRYYDQSAVGIHDLGWVAWLHDGPIVDLAGLSDHEVTEAVRDGRFDAAFVDAHLRDNEVAVVATWDEFFADVLSPNWRPAASWCVREPRVVLPARCFTFYGRTDADLDRIRSELAEFEADLPDGVTYTLR